MSNLPPSIENTNEVIRRHGISLEKGTSDPDRIREINEEYIAKMRASLGLERFGAADLPRIEDLTGSEDVIRIPLGVHRQSGSVHAGSHRFVNIYPGRLTMSEEDAEIAKQWAREQVRHYPAEDNFATSFAGVHSLIVRVEWGEDPTQPYEIDTEPSGYGLFAHFSPRIRQVAIRHRSELGNILWATMPSSRVEDSFEHATNPLALIDNMGQSPNSESGLVLPFMGSNIDLASEWIQRSVLPVDHMEDKAHLVRMGLFEELRSDDDAAYERLIEEIENGTPKVLRGLVGSCAVGLAIFKGSNGAKLNVNGKDLQGTVTKTKFLGLLEGYRERQENVIVRNFTPSTTLSNLGIKLTQSDQQSFGDPNHMCAIKRYLVVFDEKGEPHILGGAISARKSTALVHGANDAVNIVVDPPMSEVYAN